MATYVIGVSGGSGAPYARTVIQGLVGGGHDVKGVFTAAGRAILELELDVLLSGDLPADEATLEAAFDLARAPGSLELYAPDDVGAAIASGSYPSAGMAVVPCSMGTLARIAHGISSGLLERAADVMLKEGRPLVLVPRETPLSLVHLRNMTAVTEAGAVVLPAMPGFYNRPRRIQDLVDMVAGRVLQRLGVETPLLKEWHGPGRDGEA